MEYERLIHLISAENFMVLHKAGWFTKVVIRGYSDGTLKIEGAHHGDNETKWHGISKNDEMLAPKTFRSADGALNFANKIGLIIFDIDITNFIQKDEAS